MKKIILIFTIFLLTISNTFAINIELSDKIIDDTYGLGINRFIPNDIFLDYGNDLNLVKKSSSSQIKNYDFSNIDTIYWVGSPLKEYTKFSKKNEVYSFLENKLGTKKLEKALKNGEIYAIEPAYSTRGQLNFGTGSEVNLKLDRIYTSQKYIFKSDKDIKNYKIRFYLIDPNNYGGYMQFSQYGDVETLKAKLSYYNDIDLPQELHISNSNEVIMKKLGDGHLLQRYKYNSFGAGGIKDNGYSLIPYIDYVVSMEKGFNFIELNYYKYISPECSETDENCQINYNIYSFENY